MPSLMFDSDNPEILKAPIFNENRVATYADLLTPELVSFFGPRLAVIDRGQGDPLNRAHIVDVESGAVSVAQGAEKMRGWVAEGRQYVTGYANRSTMPELESAMGSAGWSRWVATLDGQMDVGDQYTAMVQFAPEAMFGMHVDVTVVFHEWWLPAGSFIGSAVARSIRDNIDALEPIAQALAGQARWL